jgi:hypothetical protein
LVVAGSVGENMVRIEGKEVQVILATNESLGNCPKVTMNEGPADGSISPSGISSIKRERDGLSIRFLR